MSLEIMIMLIFDLIFFFIFNFYLFLFFFATIAIVGSNNETATDYWPLVSDPFITWLNC